MYTKFIRVKKLVHKKKIQEKQCTKKIMKNNLHKIQP